MTPFIGPALSYDFNLSRTLTLGSEAAVFRIAGLDGLIGGIFFNLRKGL